MFIVNVLIVFKYDIEFKTRGKQKCMKYRQMENLVLKK